MLIFYVLCVLFYNLINYIHYKDIHNPFEPIWDSKFCLSLHRHLLVKCSNTKKNPGWNSQITFIFLMTFYKSLTYKPLASKTELDNLREKDKTSVKKSVFLTDKSLLMRNIYISLGRQDCLHILLKNPNETKWSSERESRRTLSVQDSGQRCKHWGRTGQCKICCFL